MANRATATITVQFNLMSMTGGVHTPSTTESRKATAFKNACAACQAADPKDHPHGVNVRYICDNGHGPFETSEVVKARELEDGSLIYAGTAQEVKDVKVDQDIEAGILQLSSYRAEDVELKTFPGEKDYVFLPKGSKEPLYDVLMELLDETGTIQTDKGGRALLGEIRLRDTVHLVRLTKRAGQLVLETLIRPDDFKQFPEHTVAADDKHVSMLKQLVELQTEDFVSENFVDDAKERVRRFVEARSSGVVLAPPASKVKSPSDNLEAMLQAALDAAKAS